MKKVTAHTLLCLLLSLAGTAATAATATAADSKASGESGGVGTAPSEPVEAKPDRSTDRQKKRKRTRHNSDRSGGSAGRQRSQIFTLRRFRLSPRNLFLNGSSGKIRYRIDGEYNKVVVKLVIRNESDGSVAKRIDFGVQRTGIRNTQTVGGELAEGTYTAKLQVTNRRDHPLKLVRAKNSKVARKASITVSSHRFPIDGPFIWSGAGGKFGAQRPGRSHQGYDIIAAEGVKVVAPTAGTISYRKYQAGGAGYYLILDASGEDRDYAFMHLQKGSIRVSQGDRVSTGQWIANVGSTGSSSGAHLHFEIWQGVWYDGGKPTDPEPSLRQWAKAQGLNIDQVALAATITSAPLD